MFLLSCVCYAFESVCLYVFCGHLLGKGWPLGSRLWCLTVSLSLSHWYPGSGVVLDCIDSWSLHPLSLLPYMGIATILILAMWPEQVLKKFGWKIIRSDHMKFEFNWPSGFWENCLNILMGLQIRSDLGWKANLDLWNLFRDIVALGLTYHFGLNRIKKNQLFKFVHI